MYESNKKIRIELRNGRFEKNSQLSNSSA